MCGIAGQLNLDRRRPADAALLRRMATAIAHRGPDDDGFFVAGPVGLGFRRLSGAGRLSAVKRRYLSAAVVDCVPGYVFRPSAIV